MARVKSIRFGKSEAEQVFAGRLMEAMREPLPDIGELPRLCDNRDDRNPRSAQSIWPLPPAPDRPYSLESLDRYPTIDLSALPPAARPAVAAALQAAVGRLAAGELPIEPRRAEDAVLAELVKSQMRQMLAGVARADGEAKCPTCEGDGEVTEDVAQAGDQTLQETFDCPDCGGSGLAVARCHGDEAVMGQVVRATLPDDCRPGVEAAIAAARAAERALIRQMALDQATTFQGLSLEEDDRDMESDLLARRDALREFASTLLRETQS